MGLAVQSSQNFIRQKIARSSIAGVHSTVTKILTDTRLVKIRLGFQVTWPDKAPRATTLRGLCLHCRQHGS